MTIRFQCECGKVLMASDEQAGLEGQCPVCGKAVAIPEAGMSEPEEPTPPEQFEEEKIAEEAASRIKGLEALERDLDEDVAGQPEQRSWVRSPRIVMLASILVVVLIALVLFVVVRRQEEPSQELVIIEDIEPRVEVQEESLPPPVGGRLEEETAEPEEAEPIVPLMAEEEVIEPVPIEPPASEESEETEAVSQEEEEQEIIASAPEVTPEVEKIPPIGSYTINLASFRVKERAERYVEEMKEKGIDAFDWEVNLPQKGRWYRVSVGGFSTRQEADDYVKELREKGIYDVFITRVTGAS